MLKDDYKINIYEPASLRKSNTMKTYGFAAIANSVRRYCSEEYSDKKIGELLGRDRTTIIYYRQQHPIWLQDVRYGNLYDACYALVKKHTYQAPYDVRKLLKLAKIIGSK